MGGIAIVSFSAALAGLPSPTSPGTATLGLVAQAVYDIHGPWRRSLSDKRASYRPLSGPSQAILARPLPLGPADGVCLGICLIAALALLAWGRRNSWQREVLRVLGDAKAVCEVHWQNRSHRIAEAIILLLRRHRFHTGCHSQNLSRAQVRRIRCHRRCKGRGKWGSCQFSRPEDIDGVPVRRPCSAFAAGCIFKRGVQRSRGCDSIHSCCGKKRW